jgi:hypothetical protein
MHNRFFALLCFVFGFLGTLISYQVSSAQDLADVIEKSERSVVRIIVKGKRGDSIGSGFVVEKTGVFVTNVHVLAGAQEATATFANGKTIAIEGTYYFDESRDICIAQLDGDNFKTIRVSEEMPRKGETVTALGAPRGLDFTATNGIVSALRKGKQLGEGRNGTWIQIDAALSPGNSGGPLINGDGEVIAMSTLASTGRSQNLNFGISADDIADALEKSTQYDLLTLPEGIGEVEVEEAASPESIITREPIPESSLAEYITECRDDYTSLSKKIVREAVEADKIFRLKRRGDIRGGMTDDTVILVNRRNKKRTYLFRNDRVKKREVRKAEQKSEALKEVKEALTKTVSNDSLYELLQHTGQFLDTSAPGTIGTLSGGIMLHPYNDNDAVVLFDDQPYLLWLPSTSGMARGAEIPPTTVYVAGTETVMVPGESTMAVTLLVSVRDSELKKAIFGDVQAGAKKGKKIEGKLRTWTAGKYKLLAKVVRLGDETIVLEKVNGKTVSIDRSKLSDGDIEYLESLAE